MGMVLNTNIPSIQAQRALGESRKEMELAMERLSTGSRINSAGDDAAGLAIVERMNTQIRGLGQATRNANDGIALVKTVENALVEVSGMLQRMRVLAVQASNDTNTATERAFADNEITSLQKEITRVSLNTRYNGAQVLNGSFAAKSLQVGTQAGETLSFSIGNVETSKLGAYVVDGVAQAAVLGTSASDTSYNNDVANADIKITSRGVERTVDVEQYDTAKEVARKINAVAASTQVVATAKTYAWLYTPTANPTVSSVGAVQARLKFITPAGSAVETAAFTMTSNNVSDAIQKINAVSSSTGVHASSTGDYKILLSEKNGNDIKVVNTSARTDLDIKSVGIDGVTPDKVTQVETVTTGTLSSYNGNGGALTVSDGTTTVSHDFSGGAPGNVAAVVSAIQAASGYSSLGFTVAASGSNITFTWKTAGVPTGTATYVSAGASDESITTSTSGFGTERSLAAASASSATDTAVIRGNLKLTSNKDFTVNQQTAAEFFTNGEQSAPLINVGSLSVLTRIQASNSLAVIDGAIETVSGMRGSLGSLQNRLDYTVSNLLKVTEFTTAARSRIADADFAAETARLAKAQVLQKAGASMLSQANASTDTVLQLLRG